MLVRKRFQPRARNTLSDPQMGSGVRLKTCRVQLIHCGEQDRLGACKSEHTEYNKSVASVVPTPAENRGSFSRQGAVFAFDELKYGPTRVLHQYDARHAAFFHGAPVEKPHLFCRYQSHGGSPPHNIERILAESA